MTAIPSRCTQEAGQMNVGTQLASLLSLSIQPEIMRGDHHIHGRSSLLS